MSMKRSLARRKIREICLSLPDTKETPTWGKPHFRVGEKIFAGCDEDGEGGRVVVSFKLAMDHAFTITQLPGFWPAPYVGHKGWVSMDVTRVTDWEAVRALILESYRLIAPKKSLAKLEVSGAEAGAAAAAKKAKPTSSRASARPSRRKAGPTSEGTRGKSRTRPPRARPRPR
jgi:predicted DNA-binding protein (MmcQ/YjbR family)